MKTSQFGRSRLSVVVGISMVAACSPVRHTLVLTFDRPEARLRSAAYPVSVASHDEWAPHTLRMPIDVEAPRDTAILVVLRDRVSLDAVRAVLGSSAASLEWDWRRRKLEYAPAIVSYREHEEPNEIVESSVRISEVLSPATSFFGQVLDLYQSDTRLKRNPNAAMLLLRPGEHVRLITEAPLLPPGFNEDGRYRAHFEWLSVHAPPGSQFACGAVDDSSVIVSAPSSGCTRQNGFASVRDLDARTKMVNVSGYYIGGLILTLAGAVAIIARN